MSHVVAGDFLSAFLFPVMQISILAIACLFMPLEWFLPALKFQCKLEWNEKRYFSIFLEYFSLWKRAVENVN